MYNWNFLDQPLLPNKLNDCDMSGIYFFIFAGWEPLTIHYVSLSTIFVFWAIYIILANFWLLFELRSWSRQFNIRSRKFACFQKSETLWREHNAIFIW